MKFIKRYISNSLGILFFLFIIVSLFSLLKFLYFHDKVTAVPVTGELEKKELKTLMERMDTIEEESMDIRRHFHQIDESIFADEHDPPLCLTCHGNLSHKKADELKSLLNMHTYFLACEVCHIRKQKGEEVRYAWYDFNTKEQVFELDGPPGNYNAKIVLFKKAENGEERRLDIPLNEDIAKRFIKEGTTWSMDQKAKARAYIHQEQSRNPVLCNECHKENGYLPLKDLQYSEKRADQIEGPEVAVMVENCMKLYLPTLFDPALVTKLEFFEERIASIKNGQAEGFELPHFSDQDGEAGITENCLICHKYSGLAMFDDSGNKYLDYVNEKSFKNSVHQNIYCTECHNDIKRFPHSNTQKVDCATECHITEPSTQQIFSHIDAIKNYELSVHGKGPADNPKENADDLPDCTYCHQNRIMQPIMCLPENPLEVACEIIDRCLACHKDEKWTRMYYNHLTHRLKSRRSAEDMVELCASCHEDETKMRRHGLEATGTFRDTFHWQSIKYGDPNAPNCIDCHAPVGFLSHEIKPKSETRSAVHKANLVRTCSNQFGIQHCHPGATPAFAGGKIHPSGEKAGLLEFRMGTFDRQEMIKKGKHKPFKSLMAEKAQEELSPMDAYQAVIIWAIKWFYKFLIGGLISFMVCHQILDYFATRREIKKSIH